MAAVPEAMEGAVIEIAEECPGVMPSTSGVVVVHSPPWAQDASARPTASTAAMTASTINRARSANTHFRGAASGTSNLLQPGLICTNTG